MKSIFWKSSENRRERKDSTVNLIVTSPPYFSLKDYGSKKQIGANQTFDEYMNSLNRVWRECIRVLAPDGKLCINIMPLFDKGVKGKNKRRITKLAIDDIIKFLEATGEMFLLSLFIWDKRKIVRFSSFGSYPYPTNIFSTFPYEWILVLSKYGKREKVSKDIKKKSKLTQKEWADWAVNSIWEMQPAKAKLENHPAPFPYELPKRLIKLHSFYDDLVLDPFAGSGTTLKAAKDLGRRYVGYEINKKYVSLVKKKLAC
jgi:modification methylase